jgi:hypothetical protein
MIFIEYMEIIMDFHVPLLLLIGEVPQSYLHNLEPAWSHT